MEVRKSPSFGMAYKIHAETFSKLSNETLSNVQRVFKNSKDALIRVTKDADVDFIYQPKFKTIHIDAIPEGLSFRQSLRILFDTIIHLGNRDYLQSLDLNELNENTLINTTKKATKAAFKQFGNKKMAERAFKDL